MCVSVCVGILFNIYMIWGFDILHILECVCVCVCVYVFVKVGSPSFFSLLLYRERVISWKHKESNQEQNLKKRNWVIYFGWEVLVDSRAHASGIQGIDLLRDLDWVHFVH